MLPLFFLIPTDCRPWFSTYNRKLQTLLPGLYFALNFLFMSCLHSMLTIYCDRGWLLVTSRNVFAEHQILHMMVCVPDVVSYNVESWSSSLYSLWDIYRQMPYLWWHFFILFYALTSWMVISCLKITCYSILQWLILTS